MERTKRPERERRGMLEIFAIGAVIAGLFYAGVRLLGDTHVAFDARQEARAARAAEIRHEILEEERKLKQQAEAEAQLAEIRAAREAAARSSEASRTESDRCIGGQVFRRIPGGWENVPGARC